MTAFGGLVDTISDKADLRFLMSSFEGKVDALASP
jgi:hypothetical protein